MTQKIQYKFGQQDKLKSRKAIEQLFAKGKSLSLFPFRIVWQITDVSGELKAGVSTSSRYFKKATHRNRIKRLTREVYRTSKNQLAEQLLQSAKGMNVFFLYQGKELPEYLFLKEKMEAAIKRLIKICNEKPEIHS